MCFIKGFIRYTVTEYSYESVFVLYKRVCTVRSILILNFVITQSIKVSIKIESECCVVFRVHFKPHG